MLMHRTIFDVEIDVYLLQSDPHAGRFGICEHDKLDVCWRLVVMEFVLARSV